MTWKQLTERDCREWKLLAINPHDRHTWRVQQASYLEGGPLMCMLPLYLHVNNKSDYDIMILPTKLKYLYQQFSYLSQNYMHTMINFLNFFFSLKQLALIPKALP